MEYVENEIILYNIQEEELNKIKQDFLLKDIEFDFSNVKLLKTNSNNTEIKENLRKRLTIISKIYSRVSNENNNITNPIKEHQHRCSNLFII